MLAQAGVLVGFSGSGGTPLLMATQIEWRIAFKSVNCCIKVKILNKSYTLPK
jgi:hypothetical protein